MVKFYIRNPGCGRVPITLGMPIAQGAAGTIHRVTERDGTIAKLYKEGNDLSEYSEKICAMLAAPPSLPALSINGQHAVQIAWPTGPIVDGRGNFRGFVMPEVDFQAATELENILQKSMRRKKGLPEFYGVRVLLAANLASLTAELHAAEHFMIDMKPSNLRFYPDSLSMAIIDCDGFSINGRIRIPARQFSDEYIAPEARGKTPDQLGLTQDLFALAVIIFRLLNNGVHPYQGIDLPDTTPPTTLQERIFSGLYAYGRQPHPIVGAVPASIHESFDDRTRELFDRAFAGTESRPTASEWKQHLNSLFEDGILVKCAVDPVNHAHFDKGCGLCTQQIAIHQRQAARGTKVQLQASALATLQSGSLSTRPPVHRFRTTPKSSKLKSTVVVAATVGVLTLLTAGYFRSEVLQYYKHANLRDWFPGFTPVSLERWPARVEALATPVPQTGGTAQPGDIGALRESLTNARAAVIRPEAGGAGEAGRQRAAETLLEEGREALAWRDYPTAERAAREVIADHNSPLVYDGSFLLGQTLADRRQFSQAVTVFDDVYHFAQKGIYAQDALIGLARSLTAINERPAACGVLRRLHSEFPEGRADLNETVSRLDERLECERERAGASVVYPWPRSSSFPASPSVSGALVPESARVDVPRTEVVPGD
jgi:hypothetical protein